MNVIDRPVILLMGLAASAGAATVTLPANDTYLDSSNTGSNADYAHADHGTFGVIKAVYDTAGNSAFGPSRVHSLFTLPSAFLSDAANGVSTAVVQFQVKTNKLSGTGFSTTAALYPLKHSFVAGTGGDTSITQDTTPPQKPNSGTAVGGADWYTYDGKSTDTWSTIGGDYDSIGTPVATFATAGGASYASFNIAALVNNPATFAEIRDNGLLLRITQDNDASFFSNNATLSLVSADTPNGFGSAGSVIYTVPEPASLALAAAGAILTTRRHRRRV